MDPDHQLPKEEEHLLLPDPAHSVLHTQPAVSEAPKKSSHALLLAAAICLLCVIGAAAVLFQQYGDTGDRTQAGLDTDKMVEIEDSQVPEVIPPQPIDILDAQLDALDDKIDEVTSKENELINEGKKEAAEEDVVTEL